MMKPRISDEAVLAAAQLEIPELRLLYLFGSTASNQENDSSDIDLAFLSRPTFAELRRWEIQNALANRLDRDVDLIDLQTTTDVLRFEIISKGKRLFALDPTECTEFEICSLRSYLRLNEQRADILRDFMGTKDGRR